MSQAQDYAEQWTNVCDSFNKPFKKLTDINMKMFGRNLTSNQEYFEEFLHAKKPEEIVVVLLKRAIAANDQSTEYLKQALNCVEECCAGVNKEFQDMATNMKEEKTDGKGSRMKK
jgi:trehalose-6-phosphate synthase